MTKTALYRHYDAEGVLLYVGVTDCLSERTKAHNGMAAWFSDVARTEAEYCLSREHALDLEAVAIRHEKPKHNQPARKDVRRKKQSHDRTPRKVVPATLNLLLEVEKYIDTHDTTDTTFGLHAVNDPSFVRDLRLGREPRSSTVAKVRGFMEAAQ